MRRLISSIAVLTLFPIVPADAQTVTKSKYIVMKIKATDRVTKQISYANELKQHKLFDDQLDQCRKQVRNDRPALEKMVPGSDVEITCEEQDQ